MPWILWLVTLEPITVLYAIPGLALTIWARRHLRKAWKIANMDTALTGAEFAGLLLRSGRQDDVCVLKTAETMADQFDPWTRTLRLSPTVYDGRSLAALAIAAQESAFASMPFWSRLRSRMIMAVSLGSLIAWFLIATGFVYRWTEMLETGMGLLSAITVGSLASVLLEKRASRAIEAVAKELLPDSLRRDFVVALRANCWRVAAIPLTTRPMRVREHSQRSARGRSVLSEEPSPALKGDLSRGER